jgi:hypothetical protein
MIRRISRNVREVVALAVSLSIALASMPPLLAEPSEPLLNRAAMSRTTGTPTAADIDKLILRSAF